MVDTASPASSPVSSPASAPNLMTVIVQDTVSQVFLSDQERQQEQLRTTIAFVVSSAIFCFAAPAAFILGSGAGLAARIFYSPIERVDRIVTVTDTVLAIVGGLIALISLSPAGAASNLFGRVIIHASPYVFAFLIGSSAGARFFTAAQR